MPGIHLIDDKDQKIGKVKALQAEKSSVKEASAGMEIAISMPEVTFDRQLKDIKYLYSDLSETQFRHFKDNKEVLNQDDIKILQEIGELKRKTKPTWGI